MGKSNDMAKRGEDISEERKSASSKADLIGLAGIGPDLAEFVIEFIEKPEIFFSMSFERRCEIENQKDTILSLVGGDWGRRSEGWLQGIKNKGS